MSKLRPAIFLDRDGVINTHVEGVYILNWEQFEFLPGVMEAMFRMYASKYEVFVVSNQSGIAREMVYNDHVVTAYDILRIFMKMDDAIVSEINTRLLCNAEVPGEPQLALSASDGKSRGDMLVPRVIRDIVFCPHHPDAGCSCRKPKPGMMYFLAYKYEIDLSKSWMIGDKESDMVAGYNAGVGNMVHIVDGARPHILGKLAPGWDGEIELPNLLNAVQYIEDNDKWETEHGR